MTTSQGLSLADIGELHENIPLRDSFIRVRGLSAEAVLTLLQRHPQILGSALVANDKGQGIKLTDILSSAPGAISAIIAQAVGDGSPEAEKSAANVPIETQMDILEAVGRLTFSKGFGPFVERITALTRAAGSVKLGKASDTKSPPPSSI